MCLYEYGAYEDDGVQWVVTSETPSRDTGNNAAYAGILMVDREVGSIGSMGRL